MLNSHCESYLFNVLKMSLSTYAFFICQATAAVNQICCTPAVLVSVSVSVYLAHQ